MLKLQPHVLFLFYDIHLHDVEFSCEVEAGNPFKKNVTNENLKFVLCI